MKWGRSILPLARLTCVEIPRQPALLLLSTTLILFIGSLPFLITHNLGEAGKLVRDSALAMMFLGSLLLAVPAACNAVSTEIRRGTAGAILSKPVSRIRFLVAKYIGVSMVMLVFSGMATMAIIMADRAAAREFQVGWRFLVPLFLAILGAYLIASVVNFFTRRPFSSTAFWCMALLILVAFIWTGVKKDNPHVNETAIEHAEHAGHDHTDPLAAEPVPIRWSLIPACALITMAALMIQALALLCALKLGVVPSLSVCSGFFMIGLMSDYLLAGKAAESLWAKGLYYSLPNWQHFWMADALTAGGTIPWGYVANGAVYALAWTGGMLCIAFGVFDRMEVC
ncbi:ABC transporter permease subunit [Kiritimatiellota bacterium B12222]|nr:ABC transporter permease subunit [Kiritimatiellota bacterium B12222]